MSSVGVFTDDDITSLRLDIFYDNIAKDNLNEKLSDIGRNQFLTSKVESFSFLDFINEQMPSLYFTGNSFDISITANHIRLGIMDTRQLVNTPPPVSTDSPQEILSNDYLGKISSDFNMISALVLSKLDKSINDTSVVFEIKVEKKGKYKKSFTHLLGNNAKLALGDASDITLSGIHLSTNETLDGLPVKTFIQFGRRGHSVKTIDSCYCELRIEFDNKGAHDVHKLKQLVLKRVNEVLVSLVEGIEVSENE